MTARLTKTGFWLTVLFVLALAGCAKYNTFFNAQRAFDDAEQVRRDRIRTGEDITDPTSGQIQNYQLCIRKCQRLIDDYPGHSLIDDALFLIGKSAYRIHSYRMSITNLNLLFQNFPAQKYQEEALFLQAMNYMYIGDVSKSNDNLERLKAQFPDSRYQAEALRVRGENAYSVENWTDARASFEEFLTAHPGDDFAPRVSLQLARALWQLHDYKEAALRLEQALADAKMEVDEVINARLLLARCYARLDRHDEAGATISAIEPDVMRVGDETDVKLLEQKGMLTVVKAENLYLAGKKDEAQAVLETMDESWQRGDVGALAGEMMGEIQLSHWDIEEAVNGFRAAVRNAKITDHPDRVRRLNADLQTYLSTEDRLEGASDAQLPAMKLTLANILLLSLERPRLALDKYLDITTTSADDSVSAVRGLYGAAIVYRDYLDLPDSSQIMFDRLMNEFPDSPQAYVIKSGESADLYSYLLTREKQQAFQQSLAEAAADSTAENLTPPPAEVTETELVATAPPPPAGGRFSYWRRRKLSRNQATTAGS